MINILQYAEDNEKRVWIIAHEALGKADCFKDYSTVANQIIRRYSPHVIAALFFGHTHKDEFTIFYDTDDLSQRNQQTAINVAYLGPSGTTFTDLNPGFRIYTVDRETWSVIDHRTIITDLSKAAELDASNAQPTWYQSYSARSLYGTVGITPTLSGPYWHNVTVAMENNVDVFNDFYKNYFKQAQISTSTACDDNCRETMICSLRAGVSTWQCAAVAALGAGEGVNTGSLQKRHLHRRLNRADNKRLPPHLRIHCWYLCNYWIRKLYLSFQLCSFLHLSLKYQKYKTYVFIQMFSQRIVSVSYFY